MTQEDKKLLLKDLLGRIPYSIRLKIGDYSDYTLIGVVISDEHPIKVEVTEKDIVYKIEVSVDNVKPYLRPMSSMTEEEKETYYNLCYENEGEVFEFGEWAARTYYHDTIDSIDYLNSIHIDYRGLIPKGLAIEVTKENNPYEN